MRRTAVLALVTLIACARGSSETVDSPPAGKQDAAIDGNGCSMQPCTILPQCGCNGNTACDVDISDDDGTACRPVNAMGNEDDACGSPAECDRGYVCLGGSSFASCKKYCTDNAECGTPRGVCLYEVNGAAGPIAGAPKVCTSNCDPTDPTAAGCPSTMKCTLFTINDNGTPTNVVDCSPQTSAGTQGADCTATNGTSGVEARCAKGFQCVKYTTEATFKCRRVCSTPGTTSAACGGAMCRTLNYMLAGVSYGVCD